jgi:hypothetical protein
VFEKGIEKSYYFYKFGKVETNSEYIYTHICMYIHLYTRARISVLLLKHCFVFFFTTKVIKITF